MRTSIDAPDAPHRLISNPAEGAILVFFAYLILAGAALYLSGTAYQVQILWPANCATFAMLLVSPYEQWWMLALSAGAAEMLLDLNLYHSGLASLGYSAANLTEVLFGASLIRRLHVSIPNLATLRDVTCFVLVAGIVAPMCGAALGAFVIVSLNGGDYWTQWRRWWLGDGIAELTVLPTFLFALFGQAFWRKELPTRGIAAFVLVTLALLAMVSAPAMFPIFQSESYSITQAYIVIPFLAWISAQAGLRGATTAVSVFTLLACWMAARGYPLFGDAVASQHISPVQSFLLVLAVTTLILAVLFDERRAAIAILEERNTLERQLFASKRTEMIGQIAGGVAHEFNNLLGLITARLDLAAYKLPPESETRADITEVIESVHGGESLTRQLLALSRGRSEERSPVAIGSSVRRAANMIAKVLGRTIDVRVEIFDKDFVCAVNEQQLQAALLNLALNARDAMPWGGRLTFRVLLIDPKEEKHQVESASTPAAGNATQVAIEIEDTGRGMTPEEIQRCFDPFFTTKPIGEGTGLGLTMVQAFAHESGGNVSVSNVPGAGAKITIYLPLSAETVTSVAREVGTNEHCSAVVLVVDDNSPLRSAILKLLQSLNYDAVEAMDAADALDKLTANSKIDVLLSDIVMPRGLNGIQLAAEARKLRPNLKVQLMTGYAEPTLRETAAIEGDKILRKPFSRAQLEAAISDALQR